MGCRERVSHAQGVYPTQDTSRMGIARVKKRKKHRNNGKRVRKVEERMGLGKSQSRSQL